MSHLLGLASHHSLCHLICHPDSWRFASVFFFEVALFLVHLHLLRLIQSQLLLLHLSPIPLFLLHFPFHKWIWIKLVNSVPFMKKTPVNQVYILIWFHWLSQLYSEWRQTSKLVNLKISAKVPGMRFKSKFEND